ncbi:transposon Tf2-8 polyprotein [Trichonephila clavipes]|nr:transposon Tf2-8 polyprotein [Trichonephila clavipes]
MIDRFSRWPEAVPIPDTTAKNDQSSNISSLDRTFWMSFISQQIKAPRCDHRYLLNLHGFLEQIGLKQPQRPSYLQRNRSAVKEDLKASCAELVYGTTLRLPSDMLNVSIIPPCDEEFITSLRNIMRHLNPVATSTHGHSAHFVHPALSSCTHMFVFLRIDKGTQINTALKDITTSPKTVSEGQKQFSSSSKCLSSTTSTRTRSGRDSHWGYSCSVNPPNGDRLIMIVCHLRVATKKINQEECMKSRKWSH